MTRFLVWLALLTVALVAAIALISLPQNCTGGGKGTGEPVRCEP